jgi:hypothetical protein
MMRARVVVFGEASKGAYSSWHRPKDLCELDAILGQPPAGSRGLYLATQTVLLQHELLFLRVDEEGYSPQDYWRGVQLLAELADHRISIDAIGLPGVGDWTLLEAIEKALRGRQPLILTSERDLYDCLSYREEGPSL